MRKRILSSLFLLLTGAPAALAQSYYPYAGYAGPAPFQTLPPGAGLASSPPRPALSWPSLPSYNAPPPQAPAPPPPPPPRPLTPPVAPPPALPVPAVARESVVESPREPMLSPLPKELTAEPDKQAPEPPPPPPPAPTAGTPLVCDLEPEPMACAKELSHELNPPRYGPRGYRVYGSLDSLYWLVRERPSPTLLSTGPLGAPGTGVILGNPNYDSQERSGARATLGTWLTEMQTFGVEVSGLWLAQRQPEFRTSAPLLARPFVNAATGAESAAVLSAPGVQAGAVTVSALSRLWGAEANFRKELIRAPLYHLDLIGGFRFLEVDDAMNITDRTTFAPNVLGLGGSSVVSSDRFGGRNSFYGHNTGLQAEFHYGRVYVDLYGKVALGDMHEVVSINGTTVFGRAGGLSAASPGGLLALPSNSGRHSRDVFAVVPEVGINFGVQLTSHLRARVGYSFLYVSNVVRGGDQIDRTVNLSQRPTLFGGAPTLAGPVRPLFDFRDTDFWAQGVNLGLEFRY